MFLCLLLLLAMLLLVFWFSFIAWAPTHCNSSSSSIIYCLVELTVLVLYYVSMCIVVLSSFSFVRSFHSLLLIIPFLFSFSSDSFCVFVCRWVSHIACCCCCCCCYLSSFLFSVFVSVSLSRFHLLSFRWTFLFSHTFWFQFIFIRDIHDVCVIFYTSQ